MSESTARVLGIIAIVIGVMLTMGGAMFLAAGLMGNLPPILFIAPAVQIFLGLVSIIGGMITYRGVLAGKYILSVVAIGFVLNMILFAATIISTLDSVKRVAPDKRGGGSPAVCRNYSANRLAAGCPLSR
jgi:hypothetical protein